MEFERALNCQTTDINDLLIFNIPIHGDRRGWFKENWQQTKMNRLGLPNFQPVQNNMSFNASAGTTRGLHAEPWDKFISVGTGSVYGAWCDLREDSSTYGAVVTIRITPDVGVFVPRGVANGFQALEDNTLYSYLVNDHWSPTAVYSNVNLNMIDWPLPITEISDKDLNHPVLSDARPVKPLKTLITGAAGQLGSALRKQFPFAEFVTRQELDITSRSLDTARDWKQYSTIINAAAYTAVDAAELEIAAAWDTNAKAVVNLARVARENNITLVHVSSDYIFDGTSDREYSESDAIAPMNVYGQSKAAGDLAAATAPRHYIIRTSWVIGDGSNFVRTMAALDKRGVKPSVVNDQIGRLSFTSDISAGIEHLLTTGAEFGIYNLTCSGEPISWADVAREIFTEPSDVTGVTTAEFFADKPEAARRPQNSALDLTKINETGFYPPHWRTRLTEYMEEI